MGKVHFHSGCHLAPAGDRTSDWGEVTCGLCLRKRPCEDASVDRTGEPCRCGRGSYAETRFHDDMDGTLHCTA